MTALPRITALAIAFCATAASAATRVTVEPLGHFLVFPEDSAPARAVSLNDAKIGAQISAQIRSIPVRVGDRVEKGDTLVQLDCRDARLAHESAVAQLALAEKNARRARSLKKSSSIAEQNYNQALTNEAQARVREKQTALQVQRCQVTAPFSGIVTARLAAEGELAAPGAPLLSVIDTEAVEASASVPEKKLTAVSTLQHLTFRFDGRDYPVELRAIAPRIDPASASREVRLNFTETRPLPGSSGRLRWRTETPHLTPSLLSQRDGGIGIFIARDGKAVFHPLPRAVIGHPAPIDLPADTPVIVDGRFGLRDGDAIEVGE